MSDYTCSVCGLPQGAHLIECELPEWARYDKEESMTVTKDKPRNWGAEIKRAKHELDDAERALEIAKRRHGNAWSHYHWLVAEHVKEVNRDKKE